MGETESKGGQAGGGLPTISGLTVTDEQAKAIQSVATFGTTVVTESSQLVRYVGRVLGTVPHDTVGLVLGDPLGFVRTVIAKQYDALLDKMFKSRGVTQTQPVSHHWLSHSCEPRTMKAGQSFNSCGPP